MNSLFFSFDGVDGVGKSTQLDLFCDWLSELGRDVVRCRDPGGTRLGEEIREILLVHSDLAIASRCEMLLYMASRAQLVDEVIRPALEAGRIVVSDRFLLANVVYQGHAGGLDVDSLWQVGLVATGGLLPDLTLLLDMDADAAVQRIGRETDRMESRGPEYLRRVRQGFLEEARHPREPIAIINAAQDAQCVQQQIRDAAQAVLSLEG